MNVRWVRTALVAACALAYLVVWAGTAEAATPRTVAPLPAGDGARSVGAVRADGGERGRRRTLLEIQTAPGVWSVAQANPTLATLPTQPAQSCIDAGLAADCSRLNQAACSPADGTAGVACYSNSEQAGDPHSVVYGRVDRKPHKIVLEYWYFYYDDFYSYDYPPDDLFWQAHEGDWEVVERGAGPRHTKAAVCGLQPALHGRAAGLGRRRAVGQPPGGSPSRSARMRTCSRRAAIRLPRR